MSAEFDFGALYRVAAAGTREGLQLKTLAELLAEGDDEDRVCRSIQPPTPAIEWHCDCEVHYRDTRWTGWELCPKYVSLVHVDGYAIDLTGVTSSAEMLDWIYQIRGKGWTDDRSELSGLLQAFYDILHPQSTLCSGGQDKRLAKNKIISRVKAVIDAWPLDPRAVKR